MSEHAYEALRAWYMKTYKELSRHYLDKKDAALFLGRFAKKEEGIYMPILPELRAFVAYYWALHQSMGRDIDESVQRKDWL